MNVVVNGMFQFLDRVYRHLGQPSLREFADRLGTNHQKLLQWSQGGSRVRDAFKILCRARLLSGKTWNQFGKELDEELIEPAPASTSKPKRRAS